MGGSLSNYMESERIITITSAELGELLMEHKKVGMEITETSKEITELDKKRQSLIVDFQKLNDKIKTLVEESTKGMLEKYETLLDANTDTDDTNIINVKVVDRLKFAQEQLDEELKHKDITEDAKNLMDEVLADDVK